MRIPCLPGARCHRARAAAAALVAVLLLAVMASGPATASVTTAAAGATGDSWTSRITWTTRQVVPGVAVRTGVASSPAEHIHEAIIDPRLARIEVTHHGIAAQRQRTSSVAAAMGALIATNAGFFITSGSFGFPGVPDGLAVYDGQVESMNNGPRAALAIVNGQPRIGVLTARVTVSVGQASSPVNGIEGIDRVPVPVHPVPASYQVNGINRIPGIVQDCGRPGGRPTSQPRQDVTCTETSELVLFTSQFGTATPRGTGTQAIAAADGVIVSAGRQAGGRVPAGGWVIQGIGAAGTWLARHAVKGQRLIVSEQVADAAGHVIPLSGSVSAGSAAPMLVSNGRVAIDATAEGVASSYAWAWEPQPRTVAGIDKSGRLILVTVDGRQPGYSDGVTLTEEADLMRSLGAVSAMNLDGGGSTAMAVTGALVNRPSDGAERADGDFVVVLPTVAGQG